MLCARLRLVYAAKDAEIMRESICFGKQVFAGYVANTTIAHNTLARLPYTGVQVGWGWGQDTFAGSNYIVNNSIDGVLQYFADGGCIYAQSPMHGV